MTEFQVREKLESTILRVRKDLKGSQLKDSASFTEDLGFDSMNLVQLAGELETSFGRSLPLTEWLSEERDRGLKLGSLVQFLSKVI